MSSPASSITFRADTSDFAIAATLLQLPTAAGTSHGKGNTRRGDGMDEGRFPCACSRVRNGTGLLSSVLSFEEKGKELMGCSRGGRL